MKHLKTDINGGFPFVLDDLRWIDAGYREFIAAVCQYMLLENGMFVTIPTISSLTPLTISDHWVYINGEVLFCQGGTFSTDASNYARYVVEDTFDAAGLKTFPNGTPSQQDTYLNRIAKIVVSPASNPTPNSYVIQLTKNLTSQIYDNLFAYYNTLLTPIVLNTQTNPNDPNNPYQVMGCSDLSKRKHLSGLFYVSAGSSSGTTLFGISPTRLKPLKNVYFTAPTILNPDDKSVVLSINTNGTVMLMTDQTYSSDYIISLDGISYL